MSLIQIEVLFSAKCPFGFLLKYHNFSSFPIYFQSRKGLSMLMPIFKVTGRAKSVWSILNFLKVTYARHTIAWRKPKLMQDLNICMFDRDFKKKDNCFYSAEVYVSLPFWKYFVLYWKVTYSLAYRVTCSRWQVCLKITFKGEVCYKRNISLGKAARNYIKISLFFLSQTNEVHLLPCFFWW